jgi:hypothetical protein
MSISAIVFIIIGIVVVFGAVQGVRGTRKWSKKFIEGLAIAGFLPSPDEKEHIEKTVTMLFHQEANIINEITEIRKVTLNNKEVYFCDVNLGGKGRYDLVFTDLFIFPLSAKTDQPLLLFLKTDSADGSEYVKDIITKKYMLSDLYKPDGLVALDLSKQPDLDAILYAYGESWNSLDSMLDSNLLQKVLQAGLHGFFVFYLGQGIAALLTLARYKNHAIYKIDWTRQWQYVQELMLDS